VVVTEPAASTLINLMPHSARYRSDAWSRSALCTSEITPASTMYSRRAALCRPSMSRVQHTRSCNGVYEAVGIKQGRMQDAQASFLRGLIAAQDGNEYRAT